MTTLIPMTVIRSARPDRYPRRRRFPVRRAVIAGLAVIAAAVIWL